MLIKKYIVLIACIVTAVGTVAGSVWKSVSSPALAQTPTRPDNLPDKEQWIILHNISSQSPGPIWVNLKRIDSIHFYDGSYDTRQNVTQAFVSLGRDAICVIDTHDIAVLRRYVTSHQLK